MMRMLHFGFPSVVRGVRHGLVPLFLSQLQISCLAAGAGSPLLSVCPGQPVLEESSWPVLCSALEEQASQPGGSMDASFLGS